MRWISLSSLPTFRKITVINFVILICAPIYFCFLPFCFDSSVSRNRVKRAFIKNKMSKKNSKNAQMEYFPSAWQYKLLQTSKTSNKFMISRHCTHTHHRARSEMFEFRHLKSFGECFYLVASINCETGFFFSRHSRTDSGCWRMSGAAKRAHRFRTLHVKRNGCWADVFAVSWCKYKKRTIHAIKDNWNVSAVYTAEASQERCSTQARKKEHLTL